MRTAIHAKLLNVFYTLTIIFSVECRVNSLPCYLFSPISLSAFCFKFYIQGYIPIKSIVALSQLKLFHECLVLVAKVVFVVAVFAAISKSSQKLVSSEISRSRGWSENVVSF